MGHDFIKKCRFLVDAEGWMVLPKEMDLRSLKSQANVYNIVESYPFEAPLSNRKLSNPAQKLHRMRSSYVLWSCG